MIKASELTAIGAIVKPHGVKGEMVISMRDDRIDIGRTECIVMDMDGIYVPFFIENVRQKGRESFIISIDGINSDTKASEVTGKTVYALRDRMAATSDDDADDGFYASDLIGFKALKPDGSTTGTITDIEDSTLNVLAIILTADGRTVYMPLAEEFITDIDPDSRTITFDAPEGIESL